MTTSRSIVVCAGPPVLAPAVSSFFNDYIIPRGVRGCQFDGERLFFRSIRVTLTLLFGFDAAALMRASFETRPAGAPQDEADWEWHKDSSSS
jgi:hypothetical protein